MWKYEKKLQCPVNIKEPNPKSLRYLNQRYIMPQNEIKGALTDIGTEELAH